MAKDFNPEGIIITFTPITGVSLPDGISATIKGLSDDMITVSRIGITSKWTQGTGGEFNKMLTGNKLGRCVINLIQTSSSNALLSFLHNLDDNLGTGGFALSIANVNGSTRADFPNASVVQPAELGYNRQDDVVKQWTIEGYMPVFNPID